VNVGQALVDACLITHVDEDQPFSDGSRLYRFVEREVSPLILFYFFIFIFIFQNGHSSHLVRLFS